MTPLQISKFIFNLLSNDVDTTPQKAVEYWYFQVLEEHNLYKSSDSVCFYTRVKDDQAVDTISSILGKVYHIDNLNINRTPKYLRESKQNNLYLRMFIF